jgi:hypothetical protein
MREMEQELRRLAGELAARRGPEGRRACHFPDSGPGRSIAHPIRPGPPLARPRASAGSGTERAPIAVLPSRALGDADDGCIAAGIASGSSSPQRRARPAGGLELAFRFRGRTSTSRTRR